MKDIFEKVMGMKLLLVIGLVVFFAIVLILVIESMNSFISPLLNFDLFYNSTNPNSNMQTLNPRIVVVQKAIDSDSDNNGIQINGALIAATLEVAALYDSKLDYNSLNDKYDETTFLSGTDSAYPSYSLLLSMAKGMIAHKVTFTCVEQNVKKGATAKSYQTSYLKELVGINGYTVKTCQSGYSEDTSSEDETAIFSKDAYEQAYLPFFFSTEMGLDKIKDATKISKYIKSVEDTYEDYAALMYNTNSYLEGVTGLDSDPVMADNMSLPLNKLSYAAGISLPFAAIVTNVFASARTNGQHRAIDLACDIGDEIHAVYDGKVIIVSNDTATDNDSYGKRIVVASDVNNDGVIDTYTTYNHLSVQNVKVGATVKSGQNIGACGSTGESTGPHLHFEIIDLSISNEPACAAKAGLWLGTADFGTKCFINPAGTLEAIASEVCHLGSKKTYEFASSITNKSSSAYKYKITMTSGDDGLLHETYNGQDYIGVALGTAFGTTGSKWKITLSSGNILYVVKVDEKATDDTYIGYCQKYDLSVIELLIDDKAKAEKAYPGVIGESGHFDTIAKFAGTITNTEKMG